MPIQTRRPTTISGSSAWVGAAGDLADDNDANRHTSQVNKSIPGSTTVQRRNKFGSDPFDIPAGSRIVAIRVRARGVTHRTVVPSESVMLSVGLGVDTTLFVSGVSGWSYESDSETFSTREGSWQAIGPSGESWTLEDLENLDARARAVHSLSGGSAS